MSNLHYHAFNPPKKLADGKTVHRWYYYWTDNTGRKIQKSCGKDVKSRQAAENYIRTLPPPESRGASQAQPSAMDLTVAEIARDMFVPGSTHLERRRQLKNRFRTKLLYPIAALFGTSWRHGVAACCGRWSLTRSWAICLRRNALRRGKINTSTP